MTDIVERLRTENTLTGYYGPPQLQEEAAAEIERLRAENERLRAALREIARLAPLVAHDLIGRVDGGKVAAVQRMADDARAALATP